MAVTIIAPSVTAAPPQVIEPIVQIKEKWESLWQTTPELLPTNITTAVAGQDLSRMVFHRRFGTVKDVHLAAYPTPAARAKTDLTDWWIRVRAMTADAPDLQTIWLGRVSGDDVAQFASSSVPAGIQQFVAYGPQRMLDKRAVGRAFATVDNFTGDVVELGWVPPLNDVTGSEIGTMGSTGESPSGVWTHLYGIEAGEFNIQWDYREYIQYLLAWFMNESGNTIPGPAWRLAGADFGLRDLETPIQWGVTQTMTQMLRRLIPLDKGFDYTIRTIPSRTPSQGPDIPEEGFEVFVFATLPDPVFFAEFSLPGNPNTVSINAGNANDLSPVPRLVTSYDRKYKKIRVLGNRIVACCSLWGALAPNVAQVPDDTFGVPDHTDGQAADDPTLVKKWDDEIEQKYKDGDGTSEEESDQDAFRRQDKFSDVYASLGAPRFWNMNNREEQFGIRVDVAVNAWVDDEGRLRQDEPPEEGEEDVNESQAPYQRMFRRTLPWIPLKEGEDWTGIGVSPSTKRGERTAADGHQAAFQKPILWLFDPETYAYLNSETFGIGVQPLRFDWGVLLRCSPNHIMGRDHFGGEGSSQITGAWPRYNYEEAIVTLAFESDQRYTMEWSHPDADDKDGILEIPIDADFHYLAPNTVVASPFPESAPSVALSGDKGKVIREDRDFMGLTMAGAIARYGFGRARANLTVRGLSPWHNLPGSILSTIIESGQSHEINGQISGVTWDMPLNGPQVTIIRAGNAP